MEPQTQDEGERRTLLRWQRMWDNWASHHPEPAAAAGYFEHGGTVFPGAVLKRMIESVRGKLEPTMGCRFLELGCGGGFFLEALGPGCSLAVGMDLSAVMVGLTRERCRVPVAQGEAGRLPFRDASFDRLLCYSVFPVLPSHDYAKTTLDEIVRVLAPQGRAFLGDIPDRAMLERVRNRPDPATPVARGWKGVLRPVLGPPWRLLKSIAGRKTLVLDVPECSYYDRDVLKSQLAAIPSIRASFLEQDIPGKYTSATRFDILIEKS